MKANPLFQSIETAAVLTDRVLVSFSGGKDSVVLLDMAMRYFSNVQGFFMYQVAGLSFQEAILRYYEDKYGIPIHRIPHFELSQWLRYGLYRSPDFDVPIIGIQDIYAYMRLNTDVHWIAAGERIADSIWRRAMIKQSGSIDAKRGRFYPLAAWTKENVTAYIRQHKLKVGAESAKLGFSFRSLLGRDLQIIKEAYPKDYAKIREWFPLADVAIFRERMLGRCKNGKESKNRAKQVSEVRDGSN